MVLPETFNAMDNYSYINTQKFGVKYGHLTWSSLLAARFHKTREAQQSLVLMPKLALSNVVAYKVSLQYRKHTDCKETMICNYWLQLNVIFLARLTFVFKTQ